MKRIFVCGGHFAPAKAVIQELLRRGDWKIYYVGRKYSMEGSFNLALEYTEMGQLPVTYLTITTGRVQRQFLTNIGQSATSLLKIFVGLAQSLFWLIRYRPKIILSFGGYVAVPAVFWAWLFGIPVVTHEQTLISGRANKLISLLADKILVSWSESLKYFPPDKVILTGNPIRQEVLDQKPATRSQRPVVYITGGSQGAKAIDLVVAKILPKLSRKYQIILGRLSGAESARAEASADLVVGRAGANTVTEILFFGKPAILIPLPYAYGHEQEENAKMVVDAGLGEILPQERLTGSKLLSLIDKMITNRNHYLDNAGTAGKKVNPAAAKNIVNQLETL